LRDVSGAALFEDPEGAVLAGISVLSLSLGPLSASVILVTLESDFSGSFLLLLGSFALADECWPALASGAVSHCRPAYPPPKATEMATRYANNAGIRRSPKANDKNSLQLGFVPRIGTKIADFHCMPKAKEEINHENAMPFRDNFHSVLGRASITPTDWMAEVRCP
jgi:hypothetical protein